VHAASATKAGRGHFRNVSRDDEVRHLVNNKGKHLWSLRKRAREMGMRTLREDGIRKVLSGMTYARRRVISGLNGSLSDGRSLQQLRRTARVSTNSMALVVGIGNPFRPACIPRSPPPSPPSSTHRSGNLGSRPYNR
jgi:hypothetical protein